MAGREIRAYVLDVAQAVDAYRELPVPHGQGQEDRP